MKWLATALLCLFCSFAQGQCDLSSYNHKPPGFIERISEPTKTILLYAGSVILEGIGDGLYDDGQKELGKLLQATSLGMLIMSPVILDMDRTNWGWYTATYLSFRIGLFDPSYNLTRGLPIGHVGSTSYWDKGLKTFDSGGNKLAFRGLFITAGVTFSIQELGKNRRPR